MVKFFLNIIEHSTIVYHMKLHASNLAVGMLKIECDANTNGKPHTQNHIISVSPLYRTHSIHKHA